MEVKQLFPRARAQVPFPPTVNSVMRSASKLTSCWLSNHTVLLSPRSFLVVDDDGLSYENVALCPGPSGVVATTVSGAKCHWFYDFKFTQGGSKDSAKFTVSAGMPAPPSPPPSPGRPLSAEQLHALKCGQAVICRGASNLLSDSTAVTFGGVLTAGLVAGAAVASLTTMLLRRGAERQFDLV